MENWSTWQHATVISQTYACNISCVVCSHRRSPVPLKCGQHGLQSLAWSSLQMKAGSLCDSLASHQTEADPV